MFMIDTAIDHVADALGVEPEEIRKKNLYSFDETTPYGMPVHVKLKVVFPPPPQPQPTNRKREKQVTNFHSLKRKYGENVKK